MSVRPTARTWILIIFAVVLAGFMAWLEVRPPAAAESAAAPADVTPALDGSPGDGAYAVEVDVQLAGPEGR